MDWKHMIMNQNQAQPTQNQAHNGRPTLVHKSSCVVGPASTTSGTQSHFCENRSGSDNGRNPKTSFEKFGPYFGTNQLKSEI